MTTAILNSDAKSSFFHIERGSGIPFVFQHGLGGSLEQAVELFDDLRGTRLMAMDCRYHGKTKVIDDNPLNLNILLGDQLRFVESVVKTTHVIGGLSLGSLLAIRTALAVPEMIMGLVLLRPAWPDVNCATDFEAVKSVADAKFRPLLSEQCGFLLEELSKLTVPTLVLGMPNDSRHPIAFAKLVSNAFPNSAFYEVPDKNKDLAAYRESVRRHTSHFLASI